MGTVRTLLPLLFSPFETTPAFYLHIWCTVVCVQDRAAPSWRLGKLCQGPFPASWLPDPHGLPDGAVSKNPWLSCDSQFCPLCLKLPGCPTGKRRPGREATANLSLKAACIRKVLLKGCGWHHRPRNNSWNMCAIANGPCRNRHANRTLDLSWLIDGFYHRSNLYGSEYFL